MWPSNCTSLTKKARRKRESPGRNFNKWSITPRLANAGARRSARNIFGEDDLYSSHRATAATTASPARDVRRHSARAKISLLRLSHPREKRIRLWREPYRRCSARRGHGSDPATKAQRISTYGIGRELKREPGRRSGASCCGWARRMRAGKFRDLALTPAGRDALRHRTPITLTKHIEVAEKVSKGKRGRDRMRRSVLRALARLRRSSRTNATCRPTLSSPMFRSAKWREVIRRPRPSSAAFPAWANRS